MSRYLLPSSLDIQPSLLSKIVNAPSLSGSQSASVEQKELETEVLPVVMFEDLQRLQRNISGHDVAPGNYPTKSSFSIEDYHRFAHRFENTQRRPDLLPIRELWEGIEPDVESTFLVWDQTNARIPRTYLCEAVIAFHGGLHIGRMFPELKTSLVHFVVRAILAQVLHPYQSTTAEIDNYIRSTREAIRLNPQLAHLSYPQKKHWLLSSQHRTAELRWLKFQAERRWWILTTRETRKVERRLTHPEPSENEVNQLLWKYTQNSDYVQPKLYGVAGTVPFH